MNAEPIDPSAQPAAPQGVAYAELHQRVEELIEKESELRRVVEIIALGESANPVIDAGDELVALGYWDAGAVAALRASNGQAPAGASKFADVIAVQRSEAESDPSDAYMVGLYNGMSMMDANYRNITDWEPMGTVPSPPPRHRRHQPLAQLRGWQMVPVELDAAMHTAMDRAFSDAMHVGVPVSPEAWAAALATAPTPAAQADSGVQPEVERLRELAATCYAGLGAECNLPEAWLDALNAAANGEPFSTKGLLPFTANGPTEGDAFRALVSFLLVTEDPIAFLRCWNEGDFEACRKEWPEAPDELYPPP